MRKAISTILIIIAALAMALLPIGCAASGYTVFAEAYAFSDDITFSARLAGGRSDYAYKRMTGIIADVDAQVSLTRDSDLARFNAAAEGVPVEVGRHCYELFLLSEKYYDDTNGAFNCAALPLVALWHLDAGSIAELRPELDGSYVSPEPPTPEQVASTASYCDPSLVTASESGGKYYLTKADSRVKLDFGGIAKGYAIDLCAAALGEYNVPSALLDISGNAYFYGPYLDAGKPAEWKVGISSPRPRAGKTLSRSYVCAISTPGDVSAVTSGDYMRYYVHDNADGKKVYVPHIIGCDGVPIGVEYAGDKWVNTDESVISATVIGKSSAACDVYATAVSVLGFTEGARLLQKVGYKGLIFTEKRFTIMGDVPLYKPDEYDGHKAYTFVGEGGAE